MLVIAKLWRGFLVVLVAALLALNIGTYTVVSATAASSLTKGGITISPPLQSIVIGPGLIQANATVGLTNNSDRDISTTIKLVDFKALDEFGGISLGQVGVPVSKYGLANWMSLSGPSSLNLAKGQATQLTINIDNRADLAPGGHYGAVVVTAASGDAAVGNKVSLKQELVSLLFVKKTGGERYGLELQSLSFKSGSDLPTTTNLRFRSTGNVHVVPRGYVTVTEPKGKLVAKGIINPESTIVLPDTSRQFVTVLQPVNSSNAKGKYKMTAYYRYDGQNQFQAKAVEFDRGSGVLQSALIYGITGVVIAGLAYLVYRRLRKPRYSAHK